MRCKWYMQSSSNACNRDIDYLLVEYVLLPQEHTIVHTEKQARSPTGNFTVLRLKRRHVLILVLNSILYLGGQWVSFVSRTALQVRTPGHQLVSRSLIL